MQPEEFDRLLLETLADGHFSRNEKRALKDVLAQEQLNAQQQAQLRQRAFAIAEQALPDVESRKILKWLEEAVKVVHQPQSADENETIAQAWFSPEHDCPRKIGYLIGSAKKQLDICVFTITDNRIARPILEAGRRGVEVRIITDNDKLHDAGSDIVELRAAGIPIRIDRTDHHMHHKFALFDNALLLTGSYNWTRSAAEHNMENFIVTNDRRLLKSFSDTFAKLWNELAAFKS